MILSFNGVFMLNSIFLFLSKPWSEGNTKCGWHFVSPSTYSTRDVIKQNPPQKDIPGFETSWVWPLSWHLWSNRLHPSNILNFTIILELNNIFPSSQIWPIHLKNKSSFSEWGHYKEKISSVSELTGQIWIIVLEYNVIMNISAWKIWLLTIPRRGFWDTWVVAWLSNCCSFQGREGLVLVPSDQWWRGKTLALSSDGRTWALAAPPPTSVTLTVTKTLEASVSTCIYGGK